ncbi:hypothetical protein [Priestia aryabhattai]
MNIKPLYPINYNYFFEKRFTNNVKCISPSQLEVIRSERDMSSFSTKFIDFVTVYSEQKEIANELSLINADEIVYYAFNLENDVLTEEITCTSELHKKIRLTTLLNKEEQQMFIKNTFETFGIYLTVHINQHSNNIINGHHYILSEFKQLIAEHSSYSTHCVDYTFIQNVSTCTNDYLGIEAILAHNTQNELDNNKGITLFLYQDNMPKVIFDNCRLTADSVKYFSNYTQEQINICEAVLTSLNNANINYDLIYNLFDDQK